MYDSLVMFSGGLDSTTILLDCLSKNGKPLCLLFDYGQKHLVELDHAKNILETLKVDYEMLKIPHLERDDDGGTMIVGNRNILFLSYAHYIASLYSIKDVYCGFCEGDDRGFPDCRKVFVESVQKSLDLGYEKDITIHTPLLGYTKADIYFQNFLRGDLRFVIEETLTCYHGCLTQNDWGKGCGECLSCKGRVKGFKEFEEYYLA